MPEIVYEDNHLIVAVKPPNLLTQGDATGDDCLLDQLKLYIKAVSYTHLFPSRENICQRIFGPQGQNSVEPT